MQVTEFMRLETVIRTDFGEYLARLQPILLRRSQDWVVSRQNAEESAENLRSAAPLTARSNSARTTDDKRTTPSTDSILLRWRPVRASSTRTDVSKITTSLIESGKLEFAGVLLHQGLEALQPNDFAQGDVNRVGAGLRFEHLHSLVSQVRVEPD
jgi:hypothetical protein